MSKNFCTFAPKFGARMTIADIQNLIKNGESRTLELKKTTGELQDGMHSACAMQILTALINGAPVSDVLWNYARKPMLLSHSIR